MRRRSSKIQPAPRASRQPRMTGVRAAQILRGLADELERNASSVEVVLDLDESRSGSGSSLVMRWDRISRSSSGESGADLGEELGDLRAAGPRAQADRILERGRSLLGTPASFGDRKVFLSALFGPIRSRDMSDVEALVRAGLLRVARADLVSAMDPRLVADSEWDRGGTRAHFLVVPPLGDASWR